MVPALASVAGSAVDAEERRWRFGLLGAQLVECDWQTLADAPEFLRSGYGEAPPDLPVGFPLVHGLQGPLGRVVWEFVVPCGRRCQPLAVSGSGASLNGRSSSMALWQPSCTR